MKMERRVKAKLRIRKSVDSEHDLHVQIARKYAEYLAVPSDHNFLYLSAWSQTYPSDRSKSTLGSPNISSHNPRKYVRSYSSAAHSDDFVKVSSVEKGTQRNRDDMEIIVFVKIARDEILPDESDNGICLHCTARFKLHYKINTDVIFVRKVNVYPVKSVVIRVNNYDAFQWMQKVEFCSGLLMEMGHSDILLRSKDVFLASYPAKFLEDLDFKKSFFWDMIVLECSPVQQGILTESTELIMTYVPEAVENSPPIQLQRDFRTLASDSPSKIQGPFDVCLSDIARDSSQRAKQLGEFRYEVVYQETTFRKMLRKYSEENTFDPLFFVGMTDKQMLKFGLFDGSYVIIYPSYYTGDSDDLEPSHYIKKEKIAMVKGLGKEYKSERLFITPHLLFSMLRCPTEKPNAVVLKRYLDDLNPLQENSASSSWSSHVPLAEEVKIAIVQCPNYSLRAPHEQSIKAYFSTPRILAPGDVITLKSQDEPEFCQNNAEDTDIRFPCIYFQVINIKGPKCETSNYLLDEKHTSVIQSGAEHSYIPVLMQTYYSPYPLGSWDKDELPGQNKYVDQLESFIVPHLQARKGDTTLSAVQPAILISGPVGCGKMSLVVAVARRLNIHTLKMNCHGLCAETSAATETRMKNAFNAAGLFSPCILLLLNVHALGRDRDGNTEDPRVASSFHSYILQLKKELQTYPVIVVATTHTPKELTKDMQEAFLHELKIEAPDEMERGEMIQGLLQNVQYSGNISIPYIAQRTAGFVLGDMAALIAHAKREAFHRLCKLCCGGRLQPSPKEEEDLLTAGVVVEQQDFNQALDDIQNAHSDTIGAPKIPNVRWGDVGGLTDIKKEILDTVQLPLQYPELLAAGLRRSGVLLYGPPGTGKTLLAKAVATECSLNFLSVKGPELINMYVGQSEQNVREVFIRARSAAPCVIFFDELDSLAPNRGRSGDSGGVMDRVVSQLLAELDGLNKSCDVFVIGATNRPDLLDPALLRPGRFDKLLYLGVSETRESQLNLLQALTRKFHLEENLDLSAIAEKCPFNLTGADFYALCSDALLNAIKRKIDQLERGETVDQSTVMVTEKDFIDALEILTPSVSEQEILHYKELRSKFTV
ncbi:hypothetical protein CHS0354_031089 [Potamilus streckersoni]|uniref:Peroxisomal ATPase PEX6 n=1 Tax=Potamilus streckersoni TaxID=2493646 RepID=A0AAE0RZY8_9BIVA|nr:hypothetical protein CHS0354_031089 [Potamilus streckersoni]